ncbi:putative secreted protein [Propionispora sp. 2/2-37]|uniref:hypothetical protein n=1 Tax=Propionispora sp. 2/2-37 TaxID=1677858 RepID=UPI0006BB5FD1|nr:hypothetical protein [Propionispora sp. 2/2-37]CUH95755.1 putative secreted protein [Propionispora sp. 2/2-37]
MMLKSKCWGIVCSIVVLLALYFPVSHSAAAESDLVNVKVHVVIDNPDYFWQYPFWGAKLDTVRLSGMGRSFTIPSQSSGEVFEFRVPQGYTLRLSLEFPGSRAGYGEISLTKRRVSEKDNLLTIHLQAPATQEVIVNSSDFDTKDVR